MKLPRRLQVIRGPVDLTPLVDVIFLLLLFFMLSSSFIVQPGFRVDLPKSAYGVPMQADSLIVSVLMEPERKDPISGAVLKREIYLFFNDQIVQLPDLQRRLTEMAKGHPSETLVIKADKEVPQGMVMEIMNVALSLKWSVVLATQHP